MSEKVCVLFPSQLITDNRSPLARYGKIITRAFPVKCHRIRIVIFAAKSATRVACRRFIFSVFCFHWRRYGRKVSFSYCSSSCLSKCKYIFSTVQQLQSKKPEIPRSFSEFECLVELLKHVAEGKHQYQHSTKEAKRCRDEMYLTHSFCRRCTFTRYMEINQLHQERLK